MSKNYSFVVELSPGAYSWCTCGMSKTIPFLRRRA